MRTIKTIIAIILFITITVISVIVFEGNEVGEFLMMFLAILVLSYIVNIWKKKGKVD